MGLLGSVRDGGGARWLPWKAGISVSLCCATSAPPLFSSASLADGAAGEHLFPIPGRAKQTG